MKNLTKKQNELLNYINKVNEVGTWENKQGSFYCECGQWKPWSDKTVESLVMKRLVTIVEYNGDGVYSLAPKK